MLDTNVDSLLDASIADTLVDDDPDRGFCNVVDNASFPVVDFMGHAGGQSVFTICIT